MIYPFILWSPSLCKPTKVSTSLWKEVSRLRLQSLESIARGRLEDWNRKLEGQSGSGKEGY